ncbi:MAG: hypothetical protein EOO11_05835 [Chitinophagaceae bacterium]|nr:MAG: hypothetical protein EOO11_05835 [Chitinophagaceae bacterium]
MRGQSSRTALRILISIMWGVGVSRSAKVFPIPFRCAGRCAGISRRIGRNFCYFVAATRAMKDLLLPYASFHAWANGLLLDALRPLPPATLDQEIVSSFPSLRRTVLHMLDAESIWWQRLQLQERIVRPSEVFEGDFNALAGSLQGLDQQWLQWVQKATAPQLVHEFIYLDLKRQPQKSMVAHVLQHLFNHGTYHRGQLVTMMRQAGATTIPNTDFIAWTRKK